MLFKSTGIVNSVLNEKFISFFSSEVIVNMILIVSIVNFFSYANRRKIHVQQITHPTDIFYPLKEYDEEDFQLRFRLCQ